MTLRYTTQMIRLVLAVVATSLLATACGSSGGSAAPEPSPPASTESDTTTSTEPETAADPAAWTGVLPDVMATRVIEACPEAVPADTSDLWADVIETLDATVADRLPGRTVFLLQPNPTTCEPLTPADALVNAEDVGAVAAQGFTNADPALRYDVYVFAGSPDDARAAVTDAITAAAGEGSEVLVRTLGQSMLLARSHAPFDARSDGDRITNFYGQLLAGFE